MACRGFCIIHRAQRPAGPFGRYATGQKRCQICSVFMKLDGLWYPCCGCRVRTRPGNSKLKQKLEITKKKHDENKNKEQHFLLIYRKNGIIANSSSLFVN
jgi:hypothetical protein